MTTCSAHGFSQRMMNMAVHQLSKVLDEQVLAVCSHVANFKDYVVISLVIVVETKFEVHN
jgi:hypothetical protein